MSDAPTDTSGPVVFPVFDVVADLAEKNLTLATITMEITNQRGETLAQTTVATCAR